MEAVDPNIETVIRQACQKASEMLILKGSDDGVQQRITGFLDFFHRPVL
jgi:hypothetical protein